MAGEPKSIPVWPALSAILDFDKASSANSLCVGVNAHNHQHLFCLRIDPNIDGPNNTVFMSDAVPSDAPVGSPENFYGNAFYAKRTKLGTPAEAATDYDGTKSRTWDMCNTNKLHPYSGKPASYKLVSREIAPLLPKQGSLVWKRAGFARHAIHVTKCTFLYTRCSRRLRINSQNR
jgi:primary-amine oxidase